MERHTAEFAIVDIVYEMLFLNLAPVAQMIEHLTSNQKVLGSNPTGPDIFSGHVSLYFNQFKPSYSDCINNGYYLVNPYITNGKEEEDGLVVKITRLEIKGSYIQIAAGIWDFLLSIRLSFKIQTGCIM